MAKFARVMRTLEVGQPNLGGRTDNSEPYSTSHGIRRKDTSRNRGNQGRGRNSGLHWFKAQAENTELTNEALHGKVALAQHSLATDHMRKWLSRLRRKAKYYSQALTTSPTYAQDLWVTKANPQTLEFIKTTKSHIIAEVGVYRGHTSQKLAEYLSGKGELHLFDFEDYVLDVKRRLNRAGYFNIIPHANSRKLMDSYNWSLMKLLEEHREGMFDYVFLDGAHTWSLDALAFFLIDKLLKKGGYIDFDDYDWSLATSPSMNPSTFPPTKKWFTPEQIEARQVKLIIELLVRRDPRYTEVVKNKIFRKTND